MLVRNLKNLLKNALVGLPYRIRCVTMVTRNKPTRTFRCIFISNHIRIYFWWKFVFEITCIVCYRGVRTGCFVLGGVFADIENFWYQQKGFFFKQSKLNNNTFKWCNSFPFYKNTPLSEFLTSLLLTKRWLPLTINSIQIIHNTLHTVY